ncbi:hypothetical protein RRG08_000394 [Elysia crispata]|uniref:Uncharacterized protein n=1 Tax=Elysia crispata TaxID=231223 RepID=A0AAE1DM62_9GAST|nr:hypothetical protein RRG08_000394 [Elysia crispata]
MTVGASRSMSAQKDVGQEPARLFVIRRAHVHYSAWFYGLPSDSDGQSYHSILISRKEIKEKLDIRVNQYG